LRLLLDTHALLWWLADDPRAKAQWREVIRDPGNDVLVSAVSVAEISIKASLGKLDVPNDLAAVLETSGFDALPLTWNHAIELGRLPWHHRDPFDRMIIAQARVEDLVVATVDPQFEPYDIKLLSDAT
jgi:PIN domain nuclease of toxin-antitoxin system